MTELVIVLPKFYADLSSAGNIMHAYIAPVIQAMCILASLVSVFFLINGGFLYISSTGKPERLEHAKKVIRNALVGLVIVLAAGAFTAILSHAYNTSALQPTAKPYTLNAIPMNKPAGGLVGVLISAVTGLIENIIQSVATPFLKALTFFTTGTPLVASNPGVFNLWLTVVAIADALFLLAIALLGFHVMSFASFGLDEIEFKHILPRIGLIFLLINSSIFLIDGVISLSNAMIHALRNALPTDSVWNVLIVITKQANGFGLAALLIMLAFLIFTVILLIYYVGRIVTLYIGAVLAPLILLIWLLPGFRDFAESAGKTYLTTIFVLFVHVTILELAASLFTGLAENNPQHTPDPLMAMIVGLAALIALLKTQGVMTQLSYSSIGPRNARKLGGQFLNGMSYLSSGGQSVMTTVNRRANGAGSAAAVRSKYRTASTLHYINPQKTSPTSSSKIKPTPSVVVSKANKSKKLAKL